MNLVKDEILDKEDNKPSSDKENVRKIRVNFEEKLKNTEEKFLDHLPTLKIKEEDLKKKLKMLLILEVLILLKRMLTSLDNLQRAKKSIQEDEVLKKVKNLINFLKI